MYPRRNASHRVHGFHGHLIGAACPCRGGVHDGLNTGDEWAERSRRPERGRFSSRRKAEAVLRLLHGEELDALSRELGVTAATLAQWRERFLGRWAGIAQEPAGR